MKQDIIEQVIENAKKNSGKELTREEIIKIIEETEKEMGIELSGFGKIDKPFTQFYSKDVINKEYKNNERMAVRVLKECKKHPNTVAYFIGNEVITYKELGQKILKYAQKLDALDLRQGDCITMCSLSTPETIYMFFAANLIGVKTRPIEPVSSEESIIQAIESTNSKYLVTSDFNFMKQRKITKKTGIEGVIALSADYTMKTIDTPEKKMFSFLSNLSRKAIKCSNKNKWMTVDEFEKIPTQKKTFEELSAPYVEGEIASILSTSGSSGLPHGVKTTDSNFILSVEGQMDSGFRVDENERMYNPMPSYSSYFWQDILLAIMYGVPTRLEPLFKSDNAVNLLLDCDSSILLIGPIIADKLQSYIRKNGITDEIKEKARGTWKHIVSGGDLLELFLELSAREALQEIDPNLKIENALGLSQTIGPAFNPNGIIDNPRAYSVGSVGLALPFTDYGVFEYDRENDYRPVDKEGFDDGVLYYEVGEIAFKCTNPNVFKGYLNDEEANSHDFIQHQDGSMWFHTGDLGYMDPAGFQYCTSRKEGLIVRSGQKVWAPKIVNIANMMDCIKEAAVIGVSDAEEKEVPALFVVFEDNITESEKAVALAELKSEISTKLNDFHVPSYSWELEKIPRSLMQKPKIGTLKEIHNEKILEKSHGKTMGVRFTNS